MAQPDVMTMEEAADYLRCTRQHVYTLARTHGLPLTKLGRRTVVRLSELTTWLDQNTERVASGKA